MPEERKSCVVVACFNPGTRIFNFSCLWSISSRNPCTSEDKREITAQFYVHPHTKLDFQNGSCWGRTARKEVLLGMREGDGLGINTLPGKDEDKQHHPLQHRRHMFYVCFHGWLRITIHRTVKKYEPWKPQWIGIISGHFVALLPQPLPHPLKNKQVQLRAPCKWEHAKLPQQLLHLLPLR